MSKHKIGPYRVEVKDGFRATVYRGRTKVGHWVISVPKYILELGVGTDEEVARVAADAARELESMKPNGGEGSYVVQMILGDRVIKEWDEYTEHRAIAAAEKEFSAAHSEADSARVITTDGELVWSSEPEENGMEPNISADLKKRYEFFKKHTGYLVGRQGVGALALARAEAAAERLGWEVYWEHDQVEYDPGEDTDYQPREVLVAVLKDDEGNVLAALGGIADPDRNMVRLTEAALALEALPNVSMEPNAKGKRIKMPNGAVMLFTDNKWKQFKYRDEVPKRVLKSEFDYLDEDDGSDGFFKYKNTWHHTSQFMHGDPFDGAGGKWDGYLGFSYSNGLVIRLSDDGETYKVGYYYNTSD